MKKVCLFDCKEIPDFHGYKIESFNPLAYFPKSSHWSLYDLLLYGLNGYSQCRALTSGAAGVDRLYREKNPHYMRMINEFIDRFRGYDLIIMSTYSFIHPEILAREFKDSIKILGFIDDPYSTYLSGIPFLWAFDGAFYISPSYIDNQLFANALKRWGNIESKWWPLVPLLSPPSSTNNSEFFSKRNKDLVYVGKPAGSKVERLSILKSHFGKRMSIHGRWPFKGFIGFLRGFLGQPTYPHLVTSLTDEARTDLYWNTKIGFNMHVSDHPYETGNMRMYETPAHGMMMVCDKGGAHAHELIFEPGKEAVYYDSVDEAIELIEYYLENENKRMKIAQAGYDRFWREYKWENRLLEFLNWAVTVKINKNSD